MTDSERALRVDLVRFAKQMITTGLVRGTSGNISAREPGADKCLITPSGVDYDTMQPEDLVLVGEVVREHARRPAGLLGDVADRRALQAVAGDDAPDGLQELLAPRVVVDVLRHLSAPPRSVPRSLDIFGKVNFR